MDKEMEFLMRLVGGAAVECIVTYETLARMSLSAVRQPGIAAAYEQVGAAAGATGTTAAAVAAVCHHSAPSSIERRG